MLKREVNWTEMVYRRGGWILDGRMTEWIDGEYSSVLSEELCRVALPLLPVSRISPNMRRLILFLSLSD